MKQMTYQERYQVWHGRKGHDVTILSGDRDTFQLATDKITIAR